MRQWLAQPGSGGAAGAALAAIVRGVGEDGFQAAALEGMQALLPAASWSVYRTGRRCQPALFLSASRGIPDRTRECWWAYLSGPYLHDGSFGGLQDATGAAPRLCHVLAREIAAEHRARVYEAHGMQERVSVVHQEDDTLFAVNFYRHDHQTPFTDAQIAAFEAVALPLLEITRKHVALGARRAPAHVAPVEADADAGASLAMLPPGRLRAGLLALNDELTARELDVCVRLLQGMTHDGIAAELAVSLTTVKTYRNRAFARLGIHFRNELFARVLRIEGA